MGSCNSSRDLSNEEDHNQNNCKHQNSSVSESLEDSREFLGQGQGQAVSLVEIWLALAEPSFQLLCVLHLLYATRQFPLCTWLVQMPLSQCEGSVLLLRRFSTYPPKYATPPYFAFLDLHPLSFVSCPVKNIKRHSWVFSVRLDPFFARFHGTCQGPVYIAFSAMYRSLSFFATSSQCAR